MKHLILPLILLILSACGPDITTQVTGVVTHVEESGRRTISYIQFTPTKAVKVLGYYAEPGSLIVCTATFADGKVYYFTIRECLVLPPVAPKKPEFGTKQRIIVERPL